jgi:hypothetical protein
MRCVNSSTCAFNDANSARVSAEELLGSVVGIQIAFVHSRTAFSRTQVCFFIRKP